MFSRIYIKVLAMVGLWSLTFLALGIAFVYASLYECADTGFDLMLKTYSVGVFIGGFLISTIVTALVTISLKRALS